ncbi:MAG: LytTR family transcriptional regulator, partial [Clostridiales Family XIII bacterium]|nr:LytTR family transcriptional regulator [Clostridiales Family XIII bacterium]
YIQTCGDKTLIVCLNTAFESTERLGDLERRLPEYFFRVDKGCLINTKRLSAVDFTERKAMFSGGDFVYMSRRGSKKLYAGMNVKTENEEETAG